MELDITNEEAIHSNYVDAEIGTGDNRVDETVSNGSGRSNSFSQNKTGHFLENQKNSIKSQPIVPGYSLL
ncbi:MAG: hypothetical protein II411_01890 [Lachnospiraceae bacterium]|nr:hypothetical protein [Lachnospiraceae bacterium]